jgi:hypothetical protein
MTGIRRDRRRRGRLWRPRPHVDAIPGRLLEVSLTSSKGATAFPCPFDSRSQYDANEYARLPVWVVLFTLPTCFGTHNCGDVCSDSSDESAGAFLADLVSLRLSLILERRGAAHIAEARLGTQVVTARPTPIGGLNDWTNHPPISPASLTFLMIAHAAVERPLTGEPASIALVEPDEPDSARQQLVGVQTLNPHARPRRSFAATSPSSARQAGQS